MGAMFCSSRLLFTTATLPFGKCPYGPLYGVSPLSSYLFNKDKILFKKMKPIQLSYGLGLFIFYICMVDFPKNILKHVHTIIKRLL